MAGVLIVLGGIRREKRHLFNRLYLIKKPKFDKCISLNTWGLVIRPRAWLKGYIDKVN